MKIRISKISKIIFFPFLKLFITALVSTLAVIVLQIFLIYFTDLIGKGIETSEYFLLALYTATAALPHAMPLAVMFSSIVSIGTLAENSEITALKSAGVSLKSIMKPLVIFGVFLTAISLLGNSYLVPKSAIRFLTLLYDISSTKPEFSIKEGVFYDGIPGYSIRVGNKNNSTKVLTDIMIYDHTRENSLPYLTIAESGTISFEKSNGDLTIELFNGHNYFDIAEENSFDYGEKPNKFLRSNFKSQKLTISLDSFNTPKSGEEMFEGNKRIKNMQRLLEDVANLGKDVQQVADYVKTSFVNKFIDLEVDAIDEKDLDENTNYQIISDQIEKNQSLDVNSTEFNYDADYVRRGAIESAEHFESYLKKASDYEKNRLYIINEYNIEFHKMISWALSCITVMILGASLGAIIRKGGLGMPLVVSGFLIVIHYIIEISAEKWGLAGKISAFNAAWAANYIIIPLSILFYYLASKDTRIMETDFYYILYRKLFKKK